MKKKIYIAGKVTGLDREKCLEKFAISKRGVEELGYEAVNPMELVPEGTEWNPAMKICIKALMDCDGIILHPDWSDSEGAIFEQGLAWKLGIENFLYSKNGLKNLKNYKWNS
jgi:nucleoside 2-deoxyribosyltransferase